MPVGAVIDWWCLSACTIPEGFMVADGSIVNDPDSPLNGQTLPDLRDKFVRGVSALGEIGQTGTDTTSLRVTSPSFSTENNEITHHHVWAMYKTDSNTKQWITWELGQEWPLTSWSNGIGNEGTGYYPLTEDFGASGRDARFETDSRTITHDHEISLDSIQVETESIQPPYMGLLKIVRIK